MEQSPFGFFLYIHANDGTVTSSDIGSVDTCATEGKPGKLLV